MGGDDIAGLQVGHAADDLAVLGEQTIAKPIDPLGIAGDKALFEQFDTMLANEYLPFGGALQAREQQVDPLCLFVHPMDQPFGDRGRGLEGIVRHHVQDRHVARVPDTAYYRDLVLRADSA